MKGSYAGEERATRSRASDLRCPIKTNTIIIKLNRLRLLLRWL
jgi:hypothetical protein